MDKLILYKEASNLLNFKEKTGQLFMPAAFINDTEEEIQRLEKLIRDAYVGGLCFFHSRASAATNFEGKKVIARNENSFETLKALIRRYQKAAKFPLLIAIDAEWGLAMRIENTPQYPYAITLGALPDDNSDLIYMIGKNIAKDCRAAGIHWNLSPCVDINNNPDNPVIGYRSFGKDRRKVTQKALAFIRGTQSEGILTSIKHFPGHGDTATDSHLHLPLIPKSKSELLENELYPFRELIDEGVESVMVGHLSVPALAEGKTTSASLSKEIIKGVLRDEMGYEGIVISDALNMHAVSKNHPVKGELEWLAFDAGNDILCFADHVTEGIETILKKASEAQIETSFERIWKLKEKAQFFNPAEERDFQPDSKDRSDSDNRNKRANSSVNGHVDTHTIENGTGLQNPRELNAKLARKCLTLIKGSKQEISDFRGSDFIGISISKSDDNQFFNHIEREKHFNYILTIDEGVKNSENILLAIFPPQIKPTDNFGFLKEELILINELVQTKNVIVYLFGNPFVLNHINIEKARAVIIAFQNFREFQEAAAEHFLGKLEAIGRMPVKIKT